MIQTPKRTLGGLTNKRSSDGKLALPAMCCISAIPLAQEGTGDE
jgi:hypothetical protein